MFLHAYKQCSFVWFTIVFSLNSQFKNLKIQEKYFFSILNGSKKERRENMRRYAYLSWILAISLNLVVASCEHLKLGFSNVNLLFRKNFFYVGENTKQNYWNFPRQWKVKRKFRLNPTRPILSRSVSSTCSIMDSTRDTKAKLRFRGRNPWILWGFFCWS